jgi:hypothetical protein
MKGSGNALLSEYLRSNINEERLNIFDKIKLYDTIVGIYPN